MASQLSPLLSISSTKSLMVDIRCSLPVFVCVILSVAIPCVHSLSLEAFSYSTVFARIICAASYT